MKLVQALIEQRFDIAIAGHAEIAAEFPAVGVVTPGGQVAANHAHRAVAAAMRAQAKKVRIRPVQLLKTGNRAKNGTQSSSASSQDGDLGPVSLSNASAALVDRFGIR